MRIKSFFNKINMKHVLISSATAIGLFTMLVILVDHQPKTDIKQQFLKPSEFTAGSISGHRAGGGPALQTDSQLVYESEQIATNQPKTNAVAVEWEQLDVPDSQSKLEVRIFNGQNWTEWTESDSTDDAKDGGDPKSHYALILTEPAQQLQYRFSISANPTGQSNEISKVRLVAIDATAGPDPTKPGPISQLLGLKTAQARVDGPRIFSRAEWGCPEPNSSPNWPPEYRVPDEVIVHHTDSAGNPSNSAAEIRAIWQYHAYGRGWGDIGYNYLIDKTGSIFQGRYYDQAYARSINQDVVGGHTLHGHNYHSVGVAALGNFTTQGVTSQLLSSIGNISGFKAYPYGWDPGGRMLGHRDADSTNCPGNNLYNSLNSARSAASGYFSHYYQLNQYDYIYKGQGIVGGGSSINLQPGQTATVYIDLQNDGALTWHNSGANPVRLGTSRPLDHPSAFADSSWISPSRPATFTEKVTINPDNSKTTTPATSIAPGQIARFTFVVRAKNNGGTFNEYFHPLAEGYIWFRRDIGLYVPITVTAHNYTYQWLHQSNHVPNQPGTSGPLSVTIKNTGDVAWTNTGNSATIRLGSRNDQPSRLHHSSWQSTTRVGSFIGKAQLNGSGQPVFDSSGEPVHDTTTTTINPGEAAYFGFTAQSPNPPAFGPQYFNFVVENITWLNDIGLHWGLNDFHARYAGQNAPVTIIKSTNPIGSVYFDYINTGSTAWQKDARIRLGTSRPLDRASAFFTTGLSSGSSPALPPNTNNWLSASRPGSFVGRVSGGSLDTSATWIEPGQTARFLFPLDARNVAPGTYNEYFRVLAEGLIWLEDYGAYQPITVQP